MVMKLSKDSVSIKLKDLLNKSPRSGRWVGAELEVESNTKLPTVDSGTWTTIADQSLRTALAREYVMRAPIPFEGVDTAITNLLKTLNNKEISEPIQDAPTTSWHVHLNALELTPNQVMTRMFAYWLLEPWLIKHCGKSRETNPFCLQLKDNIRNLVTFDTNFFNLWITDPSRVMRSPGFGESYRYSAQNYTALAKYGSLEYRAMRGSLDYDVVKPWFEALMNLWRNESFKTPTELLQFYCDNGLVKLFDTMVNVPAFQKLYTKDMEEEADEAALILSTIESNNLFTWEKWEDHIKERQYLRVLEGHRLESDEYAPPRRAPQPRAPRPSTATVSAGITGGITGSSANMTIIDDPTTFHPSNPQYWMNLGYSNSTSRSLAQDYN